MSEGESDDAHLPPARVFDGARWEPVSSAAAAAGATTSTPVEPNVGGDGGDGDVFVSVTSYRDGRRCGATLKALFDKASRPELVTVGLVEQNDPKDVKCLEEYCKLQGVDIKAPNKRVDTTDAKRRCPHFDRVRYLAVFDLGAQGPIVARALQRRNLGDEEFCLQIDSHSDFTDRWDDVVKAQWVRAWNEYAVISTAPPDVKDMDEHETPAGGDHVERRVPRICRAGFNGANLPWFGAVRPTDGIAENLREPLLSSGWNAGFSFAKCHLEEAAPYDYFQQQIVDGEEFPRYARMWTRGYDVYTPTRNVVYHDYGDEPDGHDMKGWPKMDLLRRNSIERIFTILQMPGGNANEEAQANLGLFGLGKRRSLGQFMDFVGIDLKKRTTVADGQCGNKQWVPYPETISAMDNLYDHADDLDPQPEYPLRTRSQQPIAANRPAAAVATPKFNSDLEKPGFRGVIKREVRRIAELNRRRSTSAKAPLFFFWILGLLAWYMCFSSRGGSRAKATSSKLKRSGKRTKKVNKKYPSSDAALKNV